ncbi:hypothetical protein NQZ79_g4418 [Umbelopsis isabellina]|nr:hypothetical protein NQZ79_g4418 [Umbelopsis isabellina]
MRPRYDYTSPPHQAEQPSQEPSPIQRRPQRQWRKAEPYQQFSSPFQARSSSPASSISTDLGAFLSPVPVQGVQGFRASTPRIHHQPPESISSQSFVEEASIPSPEQSYADWAAHENILSQPQHELTVLDDRPRSETSSWSFADAASINHPSVQGLSNSRPPSRYFSSESEPADDSGLEEGSDMGGGEAGGNEEEEEDEDVIPRPLRHKQTPEGRRSEQSQASQRHLLSSSFEHPDTTLWQKRGSANTSLLSQRLDRYRKDSILSRLDQLKDSPDQGASPENRHYSMSDSYRQMESRQSHNSLRSRSQFRETLRANMASRQSDANSGMRRSQTDLSLALGPHHHLTPMGSRAESRRSADKHDNDNRSKTSTPSQYRGILRQTSRYVPSRDFASSPYSQSQKPEETLSSDLTHIKQSQAKAIGKTLEKLETLLDGDTSVIQENDVKKQALDDERRWPVDAYDGPTSAVAKTQHLLERIWQLQRSLDSKETELLDARRHARWLEDQLQTARRRIDKLEYDAETRHQLQDRLLTTESSANQANQRVSELLQMNFKLVQDHEGLMRQIGQQAAITGSLGRETPWRGREKIALSRASGDFTNTRMTELQDRLRKLWDDSKQLEEYVKERSASRLSTRSPMPDTRMRPRNPSPRLLTQQQDGYQSSDDEDNESTAEDLVDLLKLLKSESEQHRHQLVKTVQLLAANVSGDEDASQDHAVRIPHGLGSLVTKIRKMEHRYEERERQLNKIIGINRRKNRQDVLSWKKRWENETREWPSAVKPLLTQLDSQDSDDAGQESDNNGSQGDIEAEEQEEDDDMVSAVDRRLASASLQDFDA